MTISVSQISNTQSFGTWLQRTNDIAYLISTNVVTTDSTTGGSITTGRGFVNGAFGSNTLYISTLTAGNLTTNGSVINVTSNLALANSNLQISVGNSTVNTVINSTSISTNTINAYNLTVSGTIVGAFSANGNIVPDTNNSILIGTSSKVFGQIYATNTFSNAIYSYSGTLNVSANLSVSGTVTSGGNLAVTGTMIINNTKQLSTGTFTFSSNSISTVDSFSTSSYRSAEYTVQSADAGTGSYHFTKLLVTHDGTTAYIAEFGRILNLSSIITFSADISSGNVRLRGTPTANGIVVKFSRNTMAV